MAILIREHVPLAPLVTLKTGGDALFLITVTTVDELKEAASFAEQKKLPLFVLGGGSNLLVSDSGFAGVVVKLSLKGLVYGETKDGLVTLTASAGEELDSVIAEVTKKEYWGLENLSHIPGSVGATPVQNVGAYGVEVRDVISEVTVFDTETKKIISMKNTECHFSYRHSIFKEQPNLIIVAVTFVLSTIPNPKISYGDLRALETVTVSPEIIRAAVIKIRAEKFPDWHTVGTAGSFFKNPIITATEAATLLSKYPDIPTYNAPHGLVKISLGYVLDKICGLKGFAVGLVRLYEGQALVLVADHGATTTDIKNFKKIISDIVFQKTFLQIEQEVTEI